MNSHYFLGNGVIVATNFFLTLYLSSYELPPEDLGAPLERTSSGEEKQLIFRAGLPSMSVVTCRPLTEEPCISFLTSSHWEGVTDHPSLKFSI